MIDRDLTPATASAEDADLAVRTGRAKDILVTLANTVSAMKIFPPEHDTVRNFSASLEAKFEDFFDISPRFEVIVSEQSFLYEDRVVYTDETPSKSLPFFFFKDGTEALYFYRGLKRRELLEFLNLIRTVSQKPAEDSDIVAALWESDFSNIQYYAPDEFLENQILADRRAVGAKAGRPGPASDLAPEPLDVRVVDRTKYSVGHVTLRPDDRSRLAQGFEGPVPEAEREQPGPGLPVMTPEDAAEVPPDDPSSTSGLSPAETEEIEALVRSNRLMWPEEEFVNLTAEIVYLEEDPAVCAASLDILRDFLLDQVRSGQFPAASLVIDRLRELQGQVEREAPPKALLIAEALGRMAGPRMLAALDTALHEDLPVGWPAVLAFFRRLGPTVLPAAAGLFERLKDPGVRDEVLAFIRDCGKDEPAVVVRLASDVRPGLSLEIIRLLAELPEDQGVSPLATFLDFKSRDIKLETIHSLGARHGSKANQILLGFLDDPDEVVRIQAAINLNHVSEKTRIFHTIDRASSKAFRRKSFKEKTAILSFLGRTRSPEALKFLTAVLGQVPLWPSAQRLEMRLAAVAGLESMGTEEALAALEDGLRTRGKKVRQACRDALGRFPARRRDGAESAT